MDEMGEDMSVKQNKGCRAVWRKGKSGTLGRDVGWEMDGGHREGPQALSGL